MPHLNIRFEMKTFHLNQGSLMMEVRVSWVPPQPNWKTLALACSALPIPNPESNRMPEIECAANEEIDWVQKLLVEAC